MGLIGNQNVINKSLAYFYGAPTTTGSATTGVQYAVGIGNFKKASNLIPTQFYWASIDGADSASLPDGYQVGDAIFPAFRADPENISSFTRIEGLGELTATAILARLSEATLSGSGDLTAALSVVTQGEATLAGTGSLTADILAVSSLAATLAGTGSVSGDLSAIVPIEAALSGTGTVAGTTNLTGLGRLEAEITPFTELSPTSLASAVMASEVETGYNLEAALRLILSSAAGKLSGAETTTVIIRNVTDGTNRIVATVDSNGNRTAVTYDVSDD